MPCRIYASSLRSTCKTALIRHKHGKVYDQLSATQNNHLDDYDTWTDIRTLSQTLRYKNFCLRSGEMQFLVRVDSWYPHRKGCQIPCHVIRMTKTGSQGMNIRGRDPFNQTFRKFRSKTQWIGSVQPEKFRKNWSTF